MKSTMADVSMMRVQSRMIEMTVSMIQRLEDF